MHEKSQTRQGKRVVELRLKLPTRVRPQSRGILGANTRRLQEHKLGQRVCSYHHSTPAMTSFKEAKDILYPENFDYTRQSIEVPGSRKPGQTGE